MQEGLVRHALLSSHNSASSFNALSLRSSGATGAVRVDLKSEQPLPGHVSRMEQLGLESEQLLLDRRLRSASPEGSRRSLGAVHPQGGDLLKLSLGQPWRQLGARRG